MPFFYLLFFALRVPGCRTAINDPRRHSSKRPRAKPVVGMSKHLLSRTSTSTTLMFRRAAQLSRHFAARLYQIQAAPEKQAFLRPIDSHPGVWGLALNRPQSKNAISVTLLQVSFTQHSTKDGHESDSVFSNLGNAWRQSHTTRGLQRHQLYAPRAL